MWKNKVVLIAVVLCLCYSHAVHALCTINVNSDLGEPQPLLIRPGTSLFYEPTTSDGIIRLNENEQMELYCTSGFASPAGIAGKLIKITCGAQNLFSYGPNKFKFSNFMCKSYSFHAAIRTAEKCYNNGIVVNVGFDIGSRFLKVYSVCHDENLEETYYVKHKFTPGNFKYQSGFDRVTFAQGQFFSQKDVNALYNRNTQRKTIAKILNCQECAEKYIHPTNDFFMARGHMAAKADFIFGSQQMATFYYINVAPQWQKFNALNWVSVEDYTRKLAATRNLQLDVYTGTFGRLELKDAKNATHKIYLSIEGKNKIPAPKLYYKIIVDNSKKSGIVLIGVNNPYLTLAEIKAQYIICPDISSKITWQINWQRENIERGYSYACTVSDFIRVVPHLALQSITNALI